MADFSTAVLAVLRNEGGWSDEAGDIGGQTYRGISETQDPEFLGWPIIQAAKDQPGFPGTLDGNSALQQMILDFYLRTLKPELHAM